MRFRERMLKVLRWLGWGFVTLIGLYVLRYWAVFGLLEFHGRKYRLTTTRML